VIRKGFGEVTESKAISVKVVVGDFFQEVVFGDE
tara:strand:- start:454 stop:555 length:102 start_codon:yes stop_codon:yes gene_type:complete